MLKKLPLGIQNFKEIITGDYVYVDKTRYIYELIEGAKYYFLSRPRRFGKSLLLDTIGEVFCGNKELFKGLWIYDSDYAFEPHPVIRLDMSKQSSKNAETLEESILVTLHNIIKHENLDIVGKNPSDVFSGLIVGMHQKYNRRIVVLIDEYDKPILDHLHNPYLSEANRQVMRSFYGILKSMDPHLEFTMITGVSKFTKTSIFSELNNLLDITMTERYAGICGIPVESLKEYFGQHIEKLKTLRAFKVVGNIYDEILAWYDGYSWDGESRLINPFALLSFFSQERFESFWYSSGSPKFLIDLIKGRPESFLSLNNLKIEEYMLDNVDIQSMALVPLLFQTGYLTVKEVKYDRIPLQYVLEIPNNEVKNAFNLQVVAALTGSNDAQAGWAKLEIMDSLKDGDLDRVHELLCGLFASIPHKLHVNKEAYYHSIFYAVMTVLGFDMDVEVSTSMGIIDAVLALDDKVYVMEFKYMKCDSKASEDKKRELFDMGLDEAMKQIDEKGYSDKYRGGKKTIYEAGFVFLGRGEIEYRMRIVD